jgi:leucyl-tRNA synthetase
MTHCDGCGIVPVPDEDLPVVLPPDVTMKGGTGSPLARHASFVEIPCPKCGEPARRETDTMDTFVDSSWYFFRYVDPHNTEAPFVRAKADYWFPIDFYVGGIEHAVGHLIYCRFWTMMMRELGLSEVDEPVTRLLCQGMVNALSYRCPNHDYLAAEDVRRSEDGTSQCVRCGSTLLERVAKMSKSKYNSVAPDELVERYGADAMRLFCLFAGPPVKGMEWSEEGIEGLHRFVHRVARLYERLAGPAIDAGGVVEGEEAEALWRKTHETIARVTADLDERLQPNTAIAAVMELVNQAYRLYERRVEDLEAGERAALAECLDVLARLLGPFAPHLAEEVWSRLGREGLLARASWPEADPAALRRDEMTLGVQVNGKRRGEIRLPRGAGEDAAVAAARAEASVARHLEGREIRKVILVPGRLLNLVVG